MNTEKEFSHQLREAIVKCGYTLRELSPILKAAPGTISRWQNGHTYPPKEAQKLILAAIKKETGPIPRNKIKGILKTNIELAKKKKKKKKKKPYGKMGDVDLKEISRNIKKRNDERRAKLTQEERDKEDKELKEWGNRMAAIQGVMEPVMKNLTERFQTGKVTFDWNGHHRNRVSSPKVPKEYEYSYRRDFGPEEDVTDHLRTHRLLGTLQDALAMSEATPEAPASIGYIHSLGCFDCGENLNVMFDGENFKVEESCEYPEGHPEYGPEINIPTGEIALADSLLHHPKLCTDGTAEGAGIKWEKSGVMNAGALNIGHGYCGNSCPGVWVRQDKNEVLIASSTWDEDSDEPNPIEGYDRVGAICTDLWWWTMADVQTLEELRLSEPGCQLGRQDVVTTVNPGKWKVNQRYHLENRDDTSTNTIYARITKVD